MNEFGALLNKLRKEKNLTQTELADKLNVTNQAVSKWETGDSYPETPQLIKLSELFDITVDDLLKGRYEKKDCKIENEPKYETAQAVLKEPKNNKPKSWTLKFALFMSARLLLVFAGVILCVIFGAVFDNDETYALRGVVGMLILISAGVFFFVAGGILDTYYYLEIPVSDHKKKTVRYALSVAFGVMLCILSAASFVAGDLFENNKVGMICAVASGFVSVAAAVIIFTFAGISHAAYAEKLREQNIELNLKRDGSDKGLARFSEIVMMTCAAIYIVLGFVFELWHPGWVIFPVGAIVCGILSAIDKSKTDK